MSYVDALLEAIAASRRSGRDISVAAVGHTGAVRDLKSRRDVRGSTLEALCRELGLEFYVGPPRSVPLEVARALELPGDCSTQDALLAINKLLRGSASSIETSPAEIAEQVVSSIESQLRETQDGLARIEQALSGSAAKYLEGGALLEADARQGGDVADGWVPAVDPLSFFEDFEGGPSHAFVRLGALSQSTRLSKFWVLDSATITMEYIEPTARDGEIVIVDVSSHEPVSGRLVAAWIPDALAVCFLRKEGDTWMATGRGDVIPQALKDNEAIMGLVAWHGPRDSSDLEWGSMGVAAPKGPELGERVIETTESLWRKLKTG